MTASIFLAKAFSIYFVIIGILFLTRKNRCKEMFTALMESKAAFMVIALFTFILGIIMVIFHPAFTPDWRSVISVLVWLTLIKGVLQLFASQKMLTFKGKMVTYSATYYIAGVIFVVLGLFLGYHGFF